MPQNDQIISIIPIMIVLIPMLGAAGAALADRYRPNWRNYVVIAATAIPFFIAAMVTPSVIAGARYYLFLDILPPAGMEFRIDLLSLFMILLFVALSTVLAIYSLGYYRDREDGRNFFYFYLLAIGGSYGVALSGNMMTFFLFFEFMSLMFFPLVSYKSTPEAQAAGLKFLFMTIISGIALFWAIVVTYNAAGTVSFGHGGLINEGTPVLLVAFCGFLISFGIKSAMLPLHFWMPDAYAFAPTPAAALSSAIMLKTGVLGLIRVFYDLFSPTMLQEIGWNNILLAFSLVSIVYGSICAFAQNDLNRRLAYSGIAQVGYMLLGIALLTEQALVGSIYHIMAHAFMKGCMFMCSGIIFVNTGKTKISEMKGIGLQMPVTMLAFTIAAVSAVGVPPLNVFVSKWHLGLGAYEAEMPAIILLLLLSSLLNASYYFPIPINAFFGCRELQNIERQRLRLQPLRIVPVILFASAAFVFTLAPVNWPLSLARAVAQIYF